MADEARKAGAAGPQADATPARSGDSSRFGADRLRPAAPYIRPLAQAVIDLLLLAVSLCLAYWIRFENAVPAVYLKQMLVLLPILVPVQYLALTLFGVPRFAWRYFGLHEARRTVAALGYVAVLLLVARLILGDVVPAYYFGYPSVVPLSVICLDFLIAIVAVGGVRLLLRIDTEGRRQREVKGDGRQPAIIVGAGSAGVVVAKELGLRATGLVPVGFLDDDPGKAGRTIGGLPVLGPVRDLASVLSRTGARSAIITTRKIRGRALRDLALACTAADAKLKLVPDLAAVAGGELSSSRVRDVEIEDLLGREPVVLDQERIAAAVAGHAVLVSGGGGSIGSELCRQICRFGARRLIILDRAENGMFYIHRELRERFPAVELMPVLGDVTDLPRIQKVLASYPVDIVFHAAAHKHVPLLQSHPCEAVKNNVRGTQILADTALKSGAGRFVMISTDKAVRPTSVMGATKRIAELYVQSLNGTGATRFMAVRFGNVLGSEGSVVPIFKEQIARGGPVTVTHPDMERYFMTIPEACQLVIEAAAVGAGGEVFLLEMGEPVKIVDLAREMIALSGRRPGEDVKVEFSGVRPGEKLSEELNYSQEESLPTGCQKLRVVRTPPVAADHLRGLVAELCAHAQAGDDTMVMRKLKEIVPEFESQVVPPVEPASAGSHGSASSVPTGDARTGVGV